MSLAVSIAAAVFTVLAFTPQENLEEAAIVRFPDGTEIACRIVDDPFERHTGLSEHECLPPERGMLFVYPQPRLLSFWMPPSMKFNVDMIFLDADRRVVLIEHDTPPCPDPKGWECPSYGPGDTPCLYVVELLGGTAEKIGLKEADILEIILPEGYSQPIH